MQNETVPTSADTLKSGLIPFKIHTPPVEDFEKYTTEGV